MRAPLLLLYKGLFTEVRGIGILRSSSARSWIKPRNTPALPLLKDLGRGFRAPALYCPWPRYCVYLPIAFGAAFALLQRRVGRMSSPPVAPSVAASKQKCDLIETCFKGTATDANNA